MIEMLARSGFSTGQLDAMEESQFMALETHLSPPNVIANLRVRDAANQINCLPDRLIGRQIRQVVESSGLSESAVLLGLLKDIEESSKMHLTVSGIGVGTRHVAKEEDSHALLTMDLLGMQKDVFNNTTKTYLYKCLQFHRVGWSSSGKPAMMHMSWTIPSASKVQLLGVWG